MDISGKEAAEIIENFARKMAKSKPIGREIQKVINKNFWDFLQ